MSSLTTLLDQDGDVDGGSSQGGSGGWGLPLVYALGVNGNLGSLENAIRPAALRALSVSVSVALHASLIVLAVFWISRAPGLIQEMSDAISVEMLLTNMTEQHEAEEVSEVVEVAAQEAQAADPLPVSELQAVETQDAPPAPSVSSELDEGMEALTGKAETEDAIGVEKHENNPKQAQAQADAEARDRKDRESERGKTSTEKKPPAAQPPDKKATDKPKKAVTAEADSAGAKAKAPRVSGSTGNVLNYGSRVRAKVAGHVPRSGAGKGTVVVSFGVTPSGGLAYARISRSSGNAAIDRSVLAGVRASSPFPVPPAGASPSQLRFSASFQFR
ncbi:TonB family protein [Hyphomicrobium sp. LHD-15]|uniref:TonB family protein n=1 Tax=Hyphomicrobium sp. LHD-15 TaxID=3072142 RepID=UPI00280EBAE0|nr:TonB family protein [Hyphomicrobium sp. LHD-15]MDQ8697107.1 TonB family protein [Hyphomicrobium sp. LHD-15]